MNTERPSRDLVEAELLEALATYKWWDVTEAVRGYRGDSTRISGDDGTVGVHRALCCRFSTAFKPIYVIMQWDDGVDTLLVATKDQSDWRQVTRDADWVAWLLENLVVEKSPCD